MATKATVQAAAALPPEPETLEPQEEPTPEPTPEPEAAGPSRSEVFQEQLFSLARMKGRNIALTACIDRDGCILELAPGSGPVFIHSLEVLSALDLGALAAAKIEQAS